MGLGGRREKQRIGKDPRNLSWADDAARFGSSYLSKFGWDTSKGLGAEGEGRTSHLKVSQKLDMLGIGAAHTKDPNGIAWKQNRDFENLLKRLNEAAVAEQVEVKVDVEEASEVQVMDIDEDDGSRKKEKKEKRKTGKDPKRNRGEDKDEDDSKPSKKAKTVEDSSEKTTPASTPSAESTDAGPSAIFRRAYVPQHRAHRARHIAAKSIASKSSTHISEILGVASTSASSESTPGSATPADQGKLTVISDTPALEQLTTSTKSVADYFKERLLAKSHKSGTSTPQTPRDLSSSREEEGERRPMMGGLGFSRVHWDSSEETKTVESQNETLKMGLSKFSSLMSATFLSSAMPPKPEPEDEPSTVKVEEQVEEADEDKEKVKRKEQKRLRKEEKARKKAEKVEKKEKTVKVEDAGDFVVDQAPAKKDKKKKKDKKDKTSPS